MPALTEDRPPSAPPHELIAVGIEPPAEIPSEIFEAALTTFRELRRLDMRALAIELGISRATLYRRAGGRDHLLGQVIWYLTRRSLARAYEGTESLKGDGRIVTVVERFMRDVHSQPALARLLDAEPEAALRILTSKHGPIQRGIIEVVERLMAIEEERGNLRLGIDHGTLAYAIVRLGESFLYADVIADNDPDVDQAVAVIGRLLREG
ncbi:MAG TPA: QsdR family transcriptional regulator [Thermoleophilaceae bacterium]